MKARDEDFCLLPYSKTPNTLPILDSQPEWRAQSNEDERGKDSLERGYFYLERCGWHIGAS